MPVYPLKCIATDPLLFSLGRQQDSYERISLNCQNKAGFLVGILPSGLRSATSTSEAKPKLRLVERDGEEDCLLSRTEITVAQLALQYSFKKRTANVNRIFIWLTHSQAKPHTLAHCPHTHMHTITR